MKTYDIAELAREKGEYVLGSAELNTHACYMVFGIMNTGEKDRTLKPGRGHEEIFCLISGVVTLRNGGQKIFLGPGQALHLRGDESWTMDNDGPSEVVYVLAGGHSGGHEHH